LAGLVSSGLTCAPLNPALSIEVFENALVETGAKLLLVRGQICLLCTFSNFVGRTQKLTFARFLLQVPPIAQADDSYALEAAQRLDIPVWRIESYQPEADILVVAPVGPSKLVVSPHWHENGDRYVVNILLENIAYFSHCMMWSSAVCYNHNHVAGAQAQRCSRLTWYSCCTPVGLQVAPNLYQLLTVPSRRI